jgi:1L-myo-inositol 1-phosphate cytidylyltransferase / CDP-L-myo-inositol myo-inositolphosphotransferase
VVSRNFNRHISIFISKRLVGVPVTPNMVSAFTFLLGVLGALSAARGGYPGMLLGAFLFKWNSILDGVDGELARVRFQHSKVGQWLDTVGDDAANLVFYAGLGVGCAALPLGPYFVACAWIGIVTSALASAQFYVELYRLGTGDLYAIEWGFDKAPPRGLRGKLLIFFRNVLKKDFAILFFLLMALAGVLPFALPIIAAAAVCNLVAATGRNLRRLRRQRA